MASQSQVTANRENAQHSCGPKTDEGKAKIAQSRTTHGLFSHTTALIPGEDPEHFKLLVIKLQIELAPGTAVEEALVATIAITQWRSIRIADWVADLTAEALTADPAADPSRLMKMFSKTGDPCEGLGRLHRLEGANQRQWHNALKELRLSKETRNRVAAGQNAIAYNDIVHWVEFTRDFCVRHGALLKPVDDSNPIPAPDAPEALRTPPPKPAADPDFRTSEVISGQ